MDFGLDDEQRAIVDTARAFVTNELYPHEDEVERLGDVPPELVDEIRAKALKAGLYAANMPEDVGGGGLNAMAMTLFERELGKASYAAAMAGRPAEQHPAGMRRRPARALPASRRQRRADRLPGDDRAGRRV